MGSGIGLQIVDDTGIDPDVFNVGQAVLNKEAYGAKAIGEARAVDLNAFDSKILIFDLYDVVIFRDGT